jgi:hypothetical protein
VIDLMELMEEHTSLSDKALKLSHINKIFKVALKKSYGVKPHSKAEEVCGVFSHTLADVYAVNHCVRPRRHHTQAFVSVSTLRRASVHATAGRQRRLSATSEAGEGDGGVDPNDDDASPAAPTGGTSRRTSATDIGCVAGCIEVASSRLHPPYVHGLTLRCKPVPWLQWKHRPHVNHSSRRRHGGGPRRDVGGAHPEASHVAREALSAGSSQAVLTASHWSECSVDPF